MQYLFTEYSKKKYSKLAHCDCMRYLPVQVFLTQSVHKLEVQVQDV